jgi:hypothetical protein
MAAVAFDAVSCPKLSEKDSKLLLKLVGDIQRERGHISTEELDEAVIESSRPRSSPTHHLFEWDPAKAHSIYLRTRVRELLGAIRIVFEDMPEQKMQALQIVVSDGVRGPMPIQKVLTSPDLTRALIEQAKLEALNWSRRYERLRHVAELRGLFVAVDVLTKSKKR